MRLLGPLVWRLRLRWLKGASALPGGLCEELLDLRQQLQCEWPWLPWLAEQL